MFTGSDFVIAWKIGSLTLIIVTFIIAVAMLIGTRREH